MKYLLGLLIALLLCTATFAQFNEQQLVRIDYENDNELTRLAVIPNSFWPEREYCFDPVNGRYIFTGFGLQDQAMHVVDVQTGEVLSQFDIPSVNNAQGNPSFEYHSDFNLIYTLLPTNANGLGVDLNSVDPSNGEYTKIATIDNAISWNNTLTALDDVNDIYYMLHANAQTMYTIDIINGNILNTQVLEGYFFRQMYFDTINTKLVAMGKANGSDFMSIVDIDPVTLVQSNFRLIDGLTNTTTGMTQGDGMSAMDPGQQLFFQVGIMNGDKLVVIDLEDGEILYSNPIFIGPGSGPGFMEKHGIEKLAYDTKNNQLLGLIRDDLLPSDIKFVEDSQEITIYPNPVLDFVSISWEQAGKQRIELFDVLGKSITTQALKPTDLSVRLDLSQLEKGFYTAVIYDSNESASVYKIQKL